MSDSSHHSRLAIAQEFLRHIGRPDAAQAVNLLADNVTYRVPGHNAIAGEFVGCRDVVDHLIKVTEETTGTFDASKWEDWMVGEYHVAGVADIHVQARSMRFRGREFVIVKFNGADEIVGITVFFEDPDALDRFIGP